MILKKPYAFFIKIFKPLHLIVALMIFYSIKLNNNVLNFLNDYLHSSQSVVGQSIYSTYVNKYIYIIPIVVIVFSMVILGIMFRKKKPIFFYLISIFSFIVVLVINFYTSNVLKMLEEAILAIKSVKLIHDLVLINILIQSIVLLFYIARGIGVNIKKFNFDSDLSKFDINESDKEEFELNVNIDFDESKRKRKEKIRNFKYVYVENRFLINTIILSFTFVIVAVTCFLLFFNESEKYIEGQLYDFSMYNIKVNETTILNTDYQGNKITSDDNILVVVDVSLGSRQESQFLYLNNFNLNISDVHFKPTEKYNNKLLDLGNSYSENALSPELKDYILIYEIPNKFINSNMNLTYNDLDSTIKISLKPKELVEKTNDIIKRINDKMSFDESLGDIGFKILNYEIKNEFILNYNYCVNKDDCLLSKEHLRPTLNTNFDKYILKLNVDYYNNSNIDIKNFFAFLSKFGSIHYKINDNWYIQKTNFEEIKSKKIIEKNVEYIGINNNIINAQEIKLVFNIRNYIYEYILK